MRCREIEIRLSHNMSDIVLTSSTNINNDQLGWTLSYTATGLSTKIPSKPQLKYESDFYQRGIK